MTALPALESRHLAELAQLLKERVGLHVRPEAYGGLRLALGARFDELDGALRRPEVYLELLRSESGDEELRKLLPLVTVGKTSFFRDERQFTALARLLPDLLARRRCQGLPVRIWSAGCATGEELYSIAITAAEAGARVGESELLGTDVNPEAVAAAISGRFDSRRVRDLAPQRVAQWFEREPEGYRVRDEVQRMIAGFQVHNLVSPVYPRPREGLWDLVFCRNVIIYFDTHTTQQVLTRFREALAPGGYLFLGYSESLFRLFDGFELTEVSGSFLYRRPEATARRPEVAEPAAAAHRYVPAPVQHLRLTPPSGTVRAIRAEPVLAPQEILDAAVQLLNAGKFGAARDLLERSLVEQGDGLALRLTLANLYGILRQNDRAQENYQAAVALEPLSAEAHLFFGIHWLADGKLEAAALELSRALFLDPDLALAHYYLGRCREAQRDPHRARLSYRNAIEAFKRQPEGRRQAFLGYYPDLPEDGGTFARAAEYALAAL
jgi:chemotaxis protein methyltransferase CheR